MNKIFSIIIIVLIFFSCKKKEIIPEITPDLIDKKIQSLKIKAQRKIFKYNSDLLFVDSKNKINRFNPDKGLITSIFQLTSKIDQNIFYQNNKLILKQKNSNIFFIFDPGEMKIIKTISDYKIEKIMGVDNEILLFLANKKLNILNFRRNVVLKQIAINSTAVIDCEFRKEKIFILLNKKYFVYDKKRDVVSSNGIKEEASSGFLLQDQYMYYGSTKRELVKYSLSRKKIKWKIKLPMTLKLKPRIIQKYIIATPEDNNIYFYKKRGTLYWWEKFSSTRLFPPVVMQENVAVFLMNNEIKFFNFKKKTVVTFQYKSIIDSNPVHIKKYLFFLNHQKDKNQQKISKVGNNYHVGIKIEPNFLKPIGKSILFRLNSINLIKPDIQINILNHSKKSIFSKKMKFSQISTFVWIPTEPGKYKLILEINARNKKKMKIEKSFRTVDLEKILSKYNLLMQQNCQADLFNK